MKKTLCALALALVLAAPMKAATVPMGMAQVLIDETTGMLQGLPMIGGTGATSGVSLTAVNGVVASVYFDKLTRSAAVQPSTATGFTLTATAAWTYRAMECVAQPCNLLVWNQSSASTLLFWIDQSTSTPAFAGISRTPGTDPIILDVAPGDVLHWTWTQSWTGNGFGIERK